MDSSDVDKATYWKYKIEKQHKKQKQKQKQKQKKSEVKHTNTYKSKIIDKSTKKQSSSISHDNFFSHTITKLKTLLTEYSHQKSTFQTPTSNYYQKDNSGSKTSRSGFKVQKQKQKIKLQASKKVKNNNTTKVSKNQSTLNTKRQKIKTFETIVKEQKRTPQKSRSRSKSRKYKLDKNSKKDTKISLSINTKKYNQKNHQKNKSKSTTTRRRIQTIMIPNTQDEQGSWKKKLMDTMVIHNHSVQQEQDKNDYISNFRVWQQYQQQLFHKKKTNYNILHKYLKGFSQVIKYKKIKQQISVCNSHKKKQKKTKLKEIVNLQQKKMLQFKQQLFSLKNTSNLNESLEMLIEKVNQNIHHLKIYQRLKRSSKELSVLSSQKSVLKKSAQKNVDNSDHVVERKGIKQDSCDHSKKESLVQSSEKDKEKIVSRDNQIKSQQQPSLNSLAYSYNEHSQAMVNNFTFPKEQCHQSSPKYEENQTIDIKFQNINIPMKDQVNKQIQSCQFLTPTVLKVDKVHQGSNQASSSSEDMLLSRSSHKRNQQQELQLQIPKVTNFDQKKKEESPTIKIQQYEQEQQQNPVFQRSHPIKEQIINQQLSELQMLLIQPKISKNNENIKIQQQSTINQQKKIQIQQIIFDQLITEITIIVNKLPLAKDILVGSFNQMTIDIFQQGNYQIQNQDESTQIIKIDSSDQYLLKLTDQALREAYQYNLTQRIIKPLGVSSMYTLKYMRRLNAEDDQNNYQENYQQDQQLPQDQGVQGYTQIIDSSLFQIFDQKFSCQPQNPYQMIMNRCLYDALNFLLDDLRPFGSRGMPGICVKNIKAIAPSVNTLINKMIQKVKYLSGIKMGCFKIYSDEAAKGAQRWQQDAVRQLQKQFNYREQDDTIQRYEMMLQIQEQLFMQQTILINIILTSSSQ